jgi:predicted ArsR family transcriptional regulator
MSHLARNTDPITSHLAAARVHEFGKSHIDKIVAALILWGPMTADEIAERSGLDKYQVCRRLPEAEKQNLVRATDAVRKTGSGRSARVWKSEK